jgi:hypothetical protein
VRDQSLVCASARLVTSLLREFFTAMVCAGVLVTLTARPRRQRDGRVRRWHAPHFGVGRLPVGNILGGTFHLAANGGPIGTQA